MASELTYQTEINLTADAAGAIQDLLTKRNLEGYALRIYISSGGCSGFQYGMTLEENPQPNDLVIEKHKVKVLIDDVSINFLKGSTIHYINDPAGDGFQIENPNLLPSCSCSDNSSCSGEGH